MKKKTRHRLSRRKAVAKLSSCLPFHTREFHRPENCKLGEFWENGKTWSLGLGVAAVLSPRWFGLV